MGREKAFSHRQIEHFDQSGSIGVRIPFEPIQVLAETQFL
jgi:hypothetical protein